MSCPEAVPRTANGLITASAAPSETPAARAHSRKEEFPGACGRELAGAVIGMDSIVTGRPNRAESPLRSLAELAGQIDQLPDVVVGVARAPQEDVEAIL